MRRRATTMTVSAVTVAVLLLGLPGIVLGSFFLWRDAVDGVHRSAVTIMNAVDRRTTAAQPVQRDVVDNAVSSSSYAASVFLRTGRSRPGGCPPARRSRTRPPACRGRG